MPVPCHIAPASGRIPKTGVTGVALRYIRVHRRTPYPPDLQMACLFSMMYRIWMEVSPSPVSWARISAFVRQLGHDIRNDLNALSLEAALLKELVSDPEAVTSASRIQTQLRDIANRLKELSARYALPAAQPAPITINELAGHLQNAVGSNALEWDKPSTDIQVKTDAALFARAFRELAQNAVEHSGLRKKPQARFIENGGGGVTLVLREVGGEDYSWPDAPFQTLRAAHYGAGIPIAAAILSGLGHAVERKRDGEATETRITLGTA